MKLSKLSAIALATMSMNALASETSIDTNLDLSAEVPEYVQVMGLDVGTVEFDASDTDSAGYHKSEVRFTIARNGASQNNKRPFAITANMNEYNDNGYLLLNSDTTTDQLSVLTAFYSTDDGNTSTRLNHGVRHDEFSSAVPMLSTASLRPADNNAILMFSIHSDQYRNVQAGNYTGNVNIVIEAI